MKEDKEKNNPDEMITIPKAEQDALLQRVQELEGMRENLLRAAADFENAKKRLVRERDDFVKFGQENLIRDLLPVMDNFERALAHMPEVKDPALKGIVSGVQMVLKQMQEILKNQGLKRLKTVGEIFDPHQHESVGFVHEPGKENEIITEVESGYLLHDRLLRAAKVRVRMPHPETSSGKPEEKSEEIT